MGVVHGTEKQLQNAALQGSNYVLCVMCQCHMTWLFTAYMWKQCQLPAK
jgi:hypothetical protein